jgi:hypothetical protein
VPCDLDLAEAGTRDEAEEAYAEQARTLRDALVAADTVLAVWREPLHELCESPIGVDRSIELHVRLPAHRLMPVALVRPEKAIHGHARVRRPDARAGRSAHGHRVRPAGRRPRLSAARRSRALPRGLRGSARAEHARRMAERLEQQETSVATLPRAERDQDPPTPPGV